MARLAKLLAGLLLAGLAVALPQGSDDFDCSSTCPGLTRVVCGTDNTVYKNDCSLRKAACVNRNLRKKNDGPCVASHPPSSTATASSSRCREECTKIYMPLCGSDDRTYENKCLLEAASCKNRNAGGAGITVASEGPCESDKDCHKNCGNTYRPVCGTNSVTYDNSCELSIATCLNPDIRQKYEGVCAVSGTSSTSSNQRPAIGQPVIPSGSFRPSSSSSSTSSQASPGQSASVVSGNNCPDTCLPGFQPVCGTDGLVYSSDCKLNLAKCRTGNTILTKRNDGVCTKDCDIDCYPESEPLCASNGVTYKNACFLAVARCKDGTIRKVSDGACAGTLRRPTCERECNDKYVPVCGSDGGTYRNLCQLHNASCFFKGLLKLSDGPCP